LVIYAAHRCPVQRLLPRIIRSFSATSKDFPGCSLTFSFNRRLRRSWLRSRSNDYQIARLEEKAAPKTINEESAFFSALWVIAVFTEGL
jgi:hypothetical protein